jgi:hypothetical protein
MLELYYRLTGALQCGDFKEARGLLNVLNPCKGALAEVLSNEADGPRFWLEVELDAVADDAQVHVARYVADENCRRSRPSNKKRKQQRERHGRD